MAEVTYSNANTIGQWVSLANRQLRNSGALDAPEKIYNGVAGSCNAALKMGSDVVKAWDDATDLDRAVEKNGSRANLRQNDAASRGDYAGNGSGSQVEVYTRTYSDKHEENDRKMKEALRRNSNGWK